MKASVFFADEKTRELFRSLASVTTEDQELFALLNTAFDAIAHDAFCGTQVPKRLIPKIYVTHYGIDNLWKYNLSKGWRLMYSVAGDGDQVIALVIEWLPHKEYERRFGY